MVVELYIQRVLLALSGSLQLRAPVVDGSVTGVVVNSVTVEFTMVSLYVELSAVVIIVEGIGVVGTSGTYGIGAVNWKYEGNR